MRGVIDVQGRQAAHIPFDNESNMWTKCSLSAQQLVRHQTTKFREGSVLNLRFETETIHHNAVASVEDESTTWALGTGRGESEAKIERFISFRNQRDS